MNVVVPEENNQFDGSPKKSKLFSRQATHLTQLEMSENHSHPSSRSFTINPLNQLDQQLNPNKEQDSSSETEKEIQQTTKTPVQPVQKNREFTGSKSEAFARDAFHIGIASILGGIFRIFLTNQFKKLEVTDIYSPTFPALPANIIGCIIMGFFVAGKSRITSYSSSLALFIGTGFCGSLTTWSSWQLQASQTMIVYKWAPGIVQVIIGFPVSAGGYVFGQHLYQFIYDKIPVSNFKADHRVTLIISGVIFILFYAICIPPLIFLTEDDLQLKVYAVACITCPWGAWIRWQAGAYLNGKSWFPLGTFTANMIGVLVGSILFSIQEYNLDYKCQTQNFFEQSKTYLDGVIIGFSGCCSTVSTWIVEQYSLEGHKKKWVYALTSILLSQAIGLLVQGVPYWTQDNVASGEECSD